MLHRPIRTLVITMLILLSMTASNGDPEYGIAVRGGKAVLAAGALTRTIRLSGADLITESLRVGGSELLAEPSGEMSVTFTHAEPNRRPVGLQPGEGDAVEQTASMSGGTDSLDVKQAAEKGQSVQWIHPVTVKANAWSSVFDIVTNQITNPRPGVTRLDIRVRSTSHPMLRDVSVDLFYEVYAGYPVIRKWVRITNNSGNWLKIEGLRIDDMSLTPGYRNRTLMTPEERGAGSSIIGFGNPDASRGIIAVSEVPSALRTIDESGRMGYADEHFEWVLGPSEQFTSEPVFHFAFSDKAYATVSGVSTALDRAVEGPFMRFLEQHVGVATDPSRLPVPLWCSWSNFGPAVTDANMREQADLAARCGFEGFQIDAGWAHSKSGTSWDCGGVEPEPTKFPDFDATCRYIKSRGLSLGLWVSTFRRPDAKDLDALPGARSLPEIKRGEGVGMSFSGPWRSYFANDMVYLHDRYGAVYVKQDLSNISFGDIADGHDSRTKSESLLRGLRGLLEAQDIIRHAAPGMMPEITHEIYWGTPGVPADIAAVKHASTYHIPPNDYSGCGNPKQRPNEKWTNDPVKLREQLIQGCFNARQRFYAHRGLPLYCIEYYGAATVNFKGSLTPEVQDRQVCSWLMGTPTVYAGDLASLTQENIARYRKRFGLIKRLQNDYGIYGYFQYSGVPAPTDTEWHWWGKLNPEGYGAVVVIRGREGSGKRMINIPWVVPNTTYHVRASFSGKDMGVLTGKQLQSGKLSLSLPTYGQEILELAPITK